MQGTPPYFGPTCSDMCTSSLYCNGGTATQIDNGCLCSNCPYNQYGTQCENKCENSLCSNNGISTLNSSKDGCVCECESAFTGIYCSYH